MRFCKYCNVSYDDSIVVCRSCGKLLDYVEHNSVTEQKVNSCDVCKEKVDRRKSSEQKIDPLWVVVIGNAIVIFFCVFLSMKDIWAPLEIYIAVSVVAYIVKLTR